MDGSARHIGRRIKMKRSLAFDTSGNIMQCTSVTEVRTVSSMAYLILNKTLKLFSASN